MKRLSLVGGMLFFLFLINLVSCKKDLDRTPDPAKQHNTMSVATFNDMPTVNNGMLEFRDAEHARDYLNYLFEACRFDSTGTGDDTTVYDTDSTLAIIESNLIGFNSLRAQALSDFEVQNSVGWDNPEDVPELHFIRDIFHRSMLNSNMDMMVGDKIFHIINEDIRVVMDANDEDLIDGINAFGTTATYTDVAYMKMWHDVEVYDASFIFIKPIPANKTTGLQYDIVRPGTEVREPCTNPYKVTFRDMYLIDKGVQPSGDVVQGDYEVDFGDGSAKSTYTSNSGLNSAFLTFDHTYPGIGTYHVTIKGKPHNGSTWEDDEEFDLDLTMNCHYGYSQPSPRYWQYPGTSGSNSRAYSGRCEILQDEPFWGLPFHRVVADTKTYKKNGNGKWYQAKGDNPSVQTWVDVYKKDCSVDYSKYDYCFKGQAREANISSGTGKVFGWNVLTSEHAIYHNGQRYSFNITVNACQ